MTGAVFRDPQAIARARSTTAAENETPVGNTESHDVRLIMLLVPSSLWESGPAGATVAPLSPLLGGISNVKRGCCAAVEYLLVYLPFQQRPFTLLACGDPINNLSYP